MVSTKYYSVIKSRMRWAGYVARMERCTQGFGGETWGKEPVTRPTRRRVHIKMDLPEVGWVGMDWIDISRDRDRWRAIV